MAARRGEQALAIEDTNVFAIGSDGDKASRKAAAGKEPAWKAAGASEGLFVWRIEQFQVKPWPKQQNGEFYIGDSYIVLKSSKAQAKDKLLHDIHFWLGQETSQDEAGTAAYKTVELDDYLQGDPVEHREVMGHESQQFQSYFGNSGLRYLKGGVASGFNHVTPERYTPRLLQVVKTAKAMRAFEVEVSRSSLNQGDCFVLDAGLTVYKWEGSSASPFEKNKANSVANDIIASRNGKAKLGNSDSEEFWSLLGGRGDIKAADAAASSALREQATGLGEGVLFRLSDQGGALSFKEEARGELMKSMLDSNDVFIVDAHTEIFVWVGKNSSDRERRNGIRIAVKYLQDNKKPLHLPITLVKEGALSQSELFNSIFKN